MAATVSSADAARLKGVVGWFLFSVAFTVVWFGLIVMFPDTQDSGARSVVTRVIIHATMLAGLWVGIARTDLDAGGRVKAWLAIAAPFTLWLATVWWLAVAGAFRPSPGRGVPALPIAIFLPVLVALPFLLRSKRIGAILDATPASWLVGLQAYRVFGGIFLIAWSRGNLSGTFALPAGSGDVLVGLLALPVAYLVQTKASGGRAAAIAWNILGLVDFAIAIGIGILSAPGPLQVIVPERPNAQLGSFPTVMIPAFAVPSSILLHVLSLRQLSRLARGANKGR
jgi:hypothetical protein